MTTVTPKRKGAKLKGSGGSSSSMKQSNLMSFFKPASSKQSQSFSSSPLKAKSAPTMPESDKENEATILGVAARKSLTSETNAGSEFKDIRKVEMHSSPVKTARHSSNDSNITEISTIKSQPVLAEAEVAQPNSSQEETGKSDQVISLSKRGRKKTSVSYAESDDDEDTTHVSTQRKRRRVVDSDDEDEEDFKPEDERDDEDEHMSDFVVDESDHSAAEIADDSDEHESIAKRKRPKKQTSPSKSASTGISSNLSTLGSKFTANSSYVSTQPVGTVAKLSPKSSSGKKSFEKENEDRYQWLVNIKDAEKRPVDHPEYDSRTLFIPSSAWAKFTAFEKQYWEIKSKMWDTVVFFKKGKFYELYENDAMIANTKFDLKIAGGGRANMKLAGVPEMSFEYWAREFISLGYKVAKVDQKESMLAKEMRGGGSKEEKIIKRELAGILTGGTLTDMEMIKDDMATFCMAIKESVSPEGEKVFGVCFVDTATSELNFIELIDDDECTKLDTLITQIKPKEILCEKHNLCSTAVKVIKYSAHNSHQIWNFLNPYSEFWDYDTTVEKLVHSRYYAAEDLDDYSNYPEILLKFKEHHHTAFAAFGGLLYYLKSLKLDESIMTLKNLKEYQISRSSASHMLLDGITLTNLEILNNNFDGGDKGTLLKLLNRAVTPFGKRLLKSWLLYPLMDIEKINLRYDAVDFLMNEEPELRVSLESSLSKLPDLERLIARVHSKSLKFRDFLKVIEGFEIISKIFKSFESYDLSSAGSMNSFVAYFPPELHAIIASWEDAFDRQEALQNVVVPAQGVDEEFDESCHIMKNLESTLNDHLQTYKKQFKSHEICYKDSGKEIYLIEVPIKIKNIPKDWSQMGATSKVKRYWSPEVKKLARELMEQKELHKTVCENIVSKLYARFDVNYKTWVAVIKSVGHMDCLIALARTSETIGYPSCRPKFLESDQGCLSFKELRHPCFVGATEFIPNDVSLGKDNANFGLLTGANAAGKSTLMRTTALAVILSQIGCYIPAHEATITPVDKIMTRLGANDNIIQGKSTFFVELSETKKILSNATQRSLVILDELGRGGSSSDGYAIAEAVLHHLASHVQPLGFFATHYGSLGLSFVNHPQIKPLRMGIIVDNSSRNITFLYKLEEGTAPGSFGMNVAAMCGISTGIVDRAEAAAKEYEQTSKLKQKHDIQQVENLSLGLQSDFVWLYQRPTELDKDIMRYEEQEKISALMNMFHMIDSLHS